MFCRMFISMAITVVENEIIYLFRGIDFSDAPASLTSENIDIEVIAHINKKGT